nr:hypothetical protein [Nanoarchaeum sp.]
MNKEKIGKGITYTLNTMLITSVLSLGAYVSYTAGRVNERNRYNQEIIRQSNTKTIGGTTLTDMDNDGLYDVADTYLPGSRVIYFKKGYGPAQSIDARVEFVEPEFFDRYESTTTLTSQLE